jgi:integrase
VLFYVNISNERKQYFERCISIHTLRHYFTFKSFLKSEAEGRSIDETAPVLSAYLGHETFHSTERYLTCDYTLYTDSQEKVYAVIESLFPEVSFE